jgi:hypothetical protein
MRSSAPPFSSLPPSALLCPVQQPTANYEESMKVLGSFQTIEHFWRIYDHLIRPNDFKSTTGKNPHLAASDLLISSALPPPPPFVIFSCLVLHPPLPIA